MYRKHSFTLVSVILTSILIVWLGAPAVAAGVGGPLTELKFLAVDYPVRFVTYLEEEVFPAFEKEHNAEIAFELVKWNVRQDKIVVAAAAGIPYDLVVTGFYSRYEEGSMGILEPLDRYIANWRYARYIPAPLWATVRWDGKTYVIPQNCDLRGMAYNKRLFGEAGLDPSQPPDDWEELRSATRKLTRLDQDGVVVRGADIGPSAHNFFWFLRQAGITEIDEVSLTSNLNRPEALEAVSTMVDIAEIAHRRDPFPGVDSGIAGFAQGRIGMAIHQPNHLKQVMNINADITDEYGVYAPRSRAGVPRVSHGFINGLAITSASRNKDLAWALIEALHDEDVLRKGSAYSGFISGRRDLAPFRIAQNPALAQFYDLYEHVQASVIPPPRDISQHEINVLMQRVYARQISPEETLLQAHELWSRLLDDWRADLGR